MGSKFGLHHLGQPDETTKAMERTAPFAWRKQCSPGGDNPTPGIKTIGRSLALTDGEANGMIAVAGAGADAWYGRVRAQMLAARWVHCWELPNEPVVDTRQQCINLGLFTRRAVDLMHADGLKAATGVFSRGRPQLAAALPDATYLRELQPCFDYGDYVALHAYWLRNPQQDAAWLQFRHRFLLAELAALGIKCQPLLLTEGGMDRPGGWRDSGISEAEYWTQLRDNDLALEVDKAVLCWTPFTNQPTRDWEPFVITPWLTAKIAEEVRARPPVVVAPPVIPPPVEVPMFPYVGKTFSAPAFIEYLKTVKPFAGLKYIVVHHSATSAVTWMQYSQDYWAKRLADYYYSEDWTAMPHLFISDRGILVENPINIYGRGVAGHNTDSLHLETVGDYTASPPSGPTLDNLVAACAALLRWAGLEISGLTNHRTLQAAFTQCPGDAFLSVWAEFQVKVAAILAPPPPAPDLPSNETTQDPAVLADKIRWWYEEAIRAYNIKDYARFEQIAYDLIDQDKGLLYRLERALEGM